MEKNVSDLSYKTVFVEGIPSTCDNDLLTETFSIKGTIKKAFVVKNNTEDKPRVGYVTYETREDAEEAAHSIYGTFMVNNIKLRTKFANKKKPVEKHGKKINLIESKDGKSLTVVEKEQNKSLNILSRMWASKSRLDKQSQKTDKTKKKNKEFCVVVTASGRKIPTNVLVKLWVEKGLKNPLKLQIDPLNGVYYLVMQSKQDCLKAVTKLFGTFIHGMPLKVSLLMDPSSKDFERACKKSRLIVRNLSFNCTEEDLRKAFDKYGIITECHIPKDKDGKKMGYGFVQFTHPFESERAKNGVNMSVIKDRRVAVDSAKPKEVFKTFEEKEELDENETENDDGDDDEDDVESGDESDEEEDDVNSGDESISSDNSEETDEDDDEEEEPEKTKVVRDKNFSSDVHEGKTIFLRNLHWEVTEEEIEEFIHSKFGKTKYCKIVMNRDTGMSMGKCFVQFLEKNDADKCLRMMNDIDENVTLKGRRFTATVAVDRSQSHKLRENQINSNKEVNDKRNIHLANYGLIRPGTLAATGVSAVELKKRERYEQTKRRKLKNPDMFVSPLRLCIHNLPRAVTDEKLKEIVVSSLTGEGLSKNQVRLKESRVMRDREKVNLEGVARSLGFGYVTFTKHEHALAALNKLNNNPEIFTSEKRPIVEFALENKKALEAKKRRVKKGKAKNVLKAKMAVLENGENSKDIPNVVSKKKAARLERRAKKRAETESNLQKQNDSLLPALDDGYVPKANKVKPSTANNSGPKNADKVVSDKKENVKRYDYQGSVGTNQAGKKVKMFKHTGAKIRKRDKGKVIERLREAKKLNRQKNIKIDKTSKISRSERQLMQSMAGTSTRKRKGALYQDMRDDADFNKLVEQTKRKFRPSM